MNPADEAWGMIFDSYTYRRVQVSASNVEEEALSHKFGSSCHNESYMIAKKFNLF
jgi:hypothetical protein